MDFFHTGLSTDCIGRDYYMELAHFRFPAYEELRSTKFYCFILSLSGRSCSSIHPEFSAC